MWVYGITFFLSLPTAPVLIFLYIEAHIEGILVIPNSINFQDRLVLRSACQLTILLVDLWRYCLATRCWEWEVPLKVLLREEHRKGWRICSYCILQLGAFAF